MRKGSGAAIFLIAVLLGGFSSLQTRVAQAQEAPADRTIALEEAVRIALQQNTNLKRARDQTRLRDVFTTQERMDFLPDLQLSTGGTRTFGRSFSQQEGEIITETSTFYGLDASANVNLFNGFENFASLERAELEETASTLQLERTRQDVVFQVFEGYTLLMQDRQLAEVRAQEVETQQELLDQVEAFVEVGRRPKSDLYQQQAAAAAARAALAEAQRQVELSRTQLMQILQLDPRGSYVFEDSLLADVPSAGGTSETYDLDRLLEAALGQRADLEALEANVAATRQGVRVARSAYWPSLSMSLGYGSDWSSTAPGLPVSGTGAEPRTITVRPEGGGPPATFEVPGSGSDPMFQRPGFFSQLNTRRGGSVSLSLGIPLFNRLERKSQVEQAQVQFQSARYDLQDRRQQVALQVRQALANYRSARTQLSATEEQLQAARQAREAARRRYELGAATFVEVAQVTSQYVSARNAQVQARYDVVLAQKRIAYYAGRFGLQDVSR